MSPTVTPTPGMPGSRFSPWWLAYAMGNPFKALGGAALTCGGLILLGFFLRIRFMPDVDLAGSSALLFAAALVGLGVLCAMVFILAAPALVCRMLMDTVRLPVDNRALAFIVGPAVLAIVAIGVYAAWHESHPLMRWVVGGVLLVLALFNTVVGPWLMWSAAPPDTALSSRKVAACLETAFAMGGSALVWFSSLYGALMLALQLARGNRYPAWLTLFMIGGWLVFVVGVNTLAARMSTVKALRSAPVLALFSLVLLVAITGSFSAISAATVRLLGFGDLRHVDLTLRFDACQSFRLSAATPLRCAGEVNGSHGILRDVTLLSRIGKQFLIESTASGGQAGQGARLVLRADDVMLWTIRAPD